MQAVVVKSEYKDLRKDCIYEVDRLTGDRYVYLKNNPRKYKSNCFRYIHNSKYISYAEAYRLQQLEQVKKNLGIK